MNFDNLLAVLAVAVAVPLILAAVPRVPVPGPVLEIVAGIVLGPAVLDLVKPDQAVQLLSTIGLAFLLFLAGLEIDVRHFRGPRARLTGLALGLSAVLALIIGIVLHAAGFAESPLLVGIILIATSLGLVVPILTDAGAAERPAGQFAIAGASLGEVSSVVLLSLFFSDRATAIGTRLLLLLLLAVLVVLAVIATFRVERSMRITRTLDKLADTSAQIRIRLSILLVAGLGALATHLGFEAILGAFIAGGILRLVDADAEHKHPLFHPKLDAIGNGFLIPVFFIASGLTFNLSVLFSSVIFAGFLGFSVHKASTAPNLSDNLAKLARRAAWVLAFLCLAGLMLGIVLWSRSGMTVHVYALAIGTTAGLAAVLLGARSIDSGDRRERSSDKSARTASAAYAATDNAISTNPVLPAPQLPAENNRSEGPNAAG